MRPKTIFSGYATALVLFMAGFFLPFRAGAESQISGGDASYSLAQSSPNAFNPAISLILSGIYSNLSQDPATYKITGFMRPVDTSGNPATTIGPGPKGFSLAESELGIYANVDPWFYGGLNLALLPDNTMSIEEAFFQTTTLPNGFTLKAGRFFSGIGYLNEQHLHTWDFTDSPLAYQAFLGGQLGDDGVQIKWVAPTDLFIELGAESGRGNNFPGTSTDRNGAGAFSGFAHAGGEMGEENSWRIGLSTLQTSPQNRRFIETSVANGQAVTNSFSGDTRIYIADFVWKWAPHGNPVYTAFKLQGEYLRMDESGAVIYNLVTPDGYSASQSGWYLQAIYKFLKDWRIGIRRDQLDGGSVSYGTVNNGNISRYSYNPSKDSLMVDYTPSEFSRFRIQFARDNSRQSNADNQFFFQYLLSIGAHGAHKF